jgi:predicted methyltransferase
MKKSPVLLFAAFLVACQPAEEAAQPEPAAQPAAATAAQPEQETAPQADTLAAILNAQPDEAKARYQYRHPRETIEFFGIEPGMTIVEGLSGQGWYSKILVPYLGSEGKLIGTAYSLEMYPLFSFMNEERLAQVREFVTTFTTGAAEWAGSDGAEVAAFHIGSMPAELEGTADAVVFIRAMHNLARFENAGEGQYLTESLDEVYRVLKPGGVFGVVQHHARDDMPDDWADGSKGYLKKQFIIDRATAAGFALEDEADFNANPKDQPTTDDFVWRLPPSYSTSRDDPELKAQYEAIGESNRMTLKFRKPM